MEEEQKPEEATEAPAEEKTEEAAPEEKKEEAPAEEAPAEAAPTCECCEESKAAEDVIRDIINFINVKKGEEVEGATHRIEADTAAELVAKLEELARAVGEICK